MSLDVSHDAWSGGYSAFGRFREWLAHQVGIPLLAMDGFGGSFTMTQGIGFNVTRSATCRAIPWDILKPDPLHVLLNHSDCDGEISVHDLPGLEERLREVGAAAWRDGIADVEHREHVQECLRFAEGCRRAIEAGEPLDFH